MNKTSKKSESFSVADDLAAVLESLKNEIAILKKKLSSKNEALIIMRKELDTCQLERDQFKLMAEQVQQRYQDLRKSLVSGETKAATINEKYAKLSSQQLNSLLHESREANKVLQFELEEMRRKLNEYVGDIKLLREQLTRQKLGVSDDTGIYIRNFPQHEREALVGRIEEVTDKYKQMKKDLEQCLDEKEELVTERDVFKTKYEKLNSEINYILKGESKDMVNVDALVLENKLLKDQIMTMETERSEAVATISKYKNLVDKKKSKSSVPNLEVCSKNISPSHVNSTSKSSDFKLLIRGLVETITDKNIALSHQRKANKVLADRLTELENKLKTLEMSGLWNLVDSKDQKDITDSIEKLRLECDTMKLTVTDSKLADNFTEDCHDDVFCPSHHGSESESKDFNVNVSYDFQS